ncbi:hypothetical protein GEMRC1_012925 [Eukaryota sp. GEM-RC1]
MSDNRHRRSSHYSHPSRDRYDSYDSRSSRDSRDSRDFRSRDRDRGGYRDPRDRDRPRPGPSYSSHQSRPPRDRRDSFDHRDNRNRDYQRDPRDRDRRDRYPNRRREREPEPQRFIPPRPPVLIDAPPYNILPNGDIERRYCKQSLWDTEPEMYPTMSVAEVAAADPEFILDSINSNAPISNRHSRRLYVGNVPLGITDSDLGTFFNSALKSSGACKFANVDPVLSCQINQDKGFAFIEFHYIEDATSALAFDGINLHGNALKVRRPKDFGTDQDMLPETRLQIDQIPGIIRKKCPPSEKRLILGNIPSFLNEDQLKRILRPFGMLMSFQLIVDELTHESKGYAYCQFCRECDTQNVLQYLPLIDFCGSCLKVGFADRSPPPPVSWYYPADDVPLDLLRARQNSHVIQVIGLLKSDDFAGSFEDLIEDIQFECENYGVVLSLYVPKPGDVAFGKAFVQYELDTDAQKALKELPKRAFNNRKFLVSLYPHDLYTTQKFY